MPVKTLFYSLMLLLSLSSLKASAQVEKGWSRLDYKQQQEFNSAFFDGCREFLIGNYEKSLVYFNTCSRINPESASSKFKLSESYQLLNLKPQALYYAKQAAELDKMNPWYGHHYASILEESGKYIEAGKEYQRIAKLSSRNQVEFFLASADAFEKGGDYKKAIRSWNEVELIWGITEDVALEKERIWLILGNKKKAENELVALHQTDTSSLIFKGYLADFYYTQGEDNQALLLINQILSKEPSQWQGLFLKTELLLSKGDPFEALKTAKAAIQNGHPEAQSIILFVKGICDETNVFSQEQKEDIINTVVSSYSSSPIVLVYIAHRELNHGNVATALKHLREAARLKPSLKEVWAEVLSQDIEIHDTLGLIADGLDAIRDFPEESSFYPPVIGALMNAGRDNELVELTQRAIPLFALDQSMQSAFIDALGSVYNKQGKYTQSDSLYEMGLSLDPGNTTLMNNYAYFLSVRGTKLEKAAKWAKKCVEGEPDNPSYIDTYGWVLYKQGNAEGADFQLKRAVDLFDKSPTIFEHYGDVLWDLGKRAEAIEQWKKALQLGGDKTVLGDKIGRKK